MKFKLLTAIVVTALGASSCTGQTYKLNATGQTLSYDEQGNVLSSLKDGDKLYGQDAHYLSGVPMSFKDNGDGTVVDQNTALMWQQTPPMEGMTWAEAKEYCENLELGGYSDWRLPTLKELFSISNFEVGWPYLDTNFFYLSNGEVTKDEQYWADNKYVGETVEGRNDAAFGVNHVTGHIKAYPAGSNMRERGGKGDQNGNERGQRMRPDGNGNDNDGQRPPMREGGENGEHRPPMQGDSLAHGQHPPMREGGEAGGQRPPMQGDNQDGQQRPPMREGGDNNGAMAPPPGGGGNRPMGNPMAKQVRAVRGNIYGENKFVDNGDGTISDLATGLMWAQADNGEGIEWVDALPYAEGATLAGYSDWRLPNVKELQSIVDYSRAPSSKGVEAAIDPIFSCTPFVNEAGDDDFGYYWTGTSACFTKGKPFYFAWYVAFGRAVNNNGADFHGAGAVRFDSKADNNIAVEGGEERYYNFVRLVRDTSKK
ncbi:MAG: DUF1566 domain-containing protein [Rikenellaceae bacterium]